MNGGTSSSSSIRSGGSAPPSHCVTVEPATGGDAAAAAGPSPAVPCDVRAKRDQPKERRATGAGRSTPAARLAVAALAFLAGLACGLCLALVPPPPDQRAGSSPATRCAATPTTTDRPIVVLHSPVMAHQVVTPAPSSAAAAVSFVRMQRIAHADADADAVVVVREVPPQPPSPNVTFNASTPKPAAVRSSEAVNGIFWSDGVEKSLPLGYDASDAERWRDYVKSARVERIEPGCGRMQNRLVTFSNGTKSCVRYRQNGDQIQGEIFTFYLGQALGLRNLPPSSVRLVRSTDDQWSGVASRLNEAQWADERAVVMTRFLDGLEPAYIPAQLRSHGEASLRPLDFASHRLDEPSHRRELVALAQWSDLVVLDYLTANLDRVVNNMYNMQWNRAMMDSPAHNLAADPATGLLVFLDNESGLLHGYRLLDKYEPFHEQLIGSLCVFRRSTVRRLERMRDERSVDATLRDLYGAANDPRTADALPFLPDKSLKILNDRMDRVLRQAAKCQAQFGSNAGNADNAGTD